MIVNGMGWTEIRGRLEGWIGVGFGIRGVRYRGVTVAMTVERKLDHGLDRKGFIYERNI